MMPTLQQTESPAFRHKADSYDAHAHVQADAAQWLAEWLPDDAGHACCLELGAGTGLLTQHLVGRFAHIESSDLSPEMLRVCRKRAPEAATRVRDAFAPPPHPEQWDCLTSSSLLQWAPCPLTVMRQWRDLIRVNGRMVLGFFAKPSLPELTDVLGHGPVDWRSPEDWRESFAWAGLNIVRLEADTRRYHYANPLEFWKSLHGTGATVPRRLPPGEMLRILRAYESNFREDQGVYASWTFCRAELTA